MTQYISSIIVDDEANGQENASFLLQEYHPRIKIVGMATSVQDAEQLIRKLQPQLVFLDIQLGAETVFSLLRRLETINFEIIFITAHENFALRAFEFMAIDYLLKPIEIDKLNKAVNSAIERIDNKAIHVSIEEMMLHVQNFNRKQHKIALSTQSGYDMVYIREIMYCLSEGSYTEFHFVSGENLLVSKNLKYYESLLKDYGFSRSHNTALVNLSYVKRIDRSEGGHLVMEDDAVLPISKSKRQELEALIKYNRRLI